MQWSIIRQIKRNEVLIHTTLGETWEHCIKWKESVTKDQPYMILSTWNIQKRQIHRNRKISECLGNWGLVAKGIGFFVGVMKIFWNQLLWWLYNYKYTKTHWILFFMWINYMMYKLYFDKTVIPPKVSLLIRVKLNIYISLSLVSQSMQWFNAPIPTCILPSQRDLDHHSQTTEGSPISHRWDQESLCRDLSLLYRLTYLVLN